MGPDQGGVSQGLHLWRAAINVVPDEVEGSGGFDSDACYVVVMQCNVNTIYIASSYCECGHENASTTRNVK